MAHKVRKRRARMPKKGRQRAAGRAAEMIAAMPLQELRQARKLSQQALAAALGQRQSGISKIEQRTDIYLSTLRRYIEAMDGRLDIVAHFPDGDVRINQFEEIEAPAGGVSARAETRKAITRLRGPILEAAAEHGARGVRLFGSVVRGEDTAASDIDFLVSLDPGRTLLDLARLEARLEELLQRPVDVVTPDSLRESIRATALREAVPV